MIAAIRLQRVARDHQPVFDLLAFVGIAMGLIGAPASVGEPFYPRQ